MTERAIIIGAGQAGAQAAQSMRQGGFDGDIVMFGDEPCLPYQRPPLSKAYLKGELEEQRLYLRPAQFYETHNIDLRLSQRIEKIDRHLKTVVAADGNSLAYDKLLLATGAPPRRLSVEGAALDNIFYLRTLKDSDALRSILSTEGRIVIVGAGYIGLEVAAVARAAGRSATVLEIADRVLARVACKPVSDFYETLHRTHGVDLRLSTGLESFLGEKGRIEAVKLTDGEELACSAVLVGIGAAPETGLAEETGLEVDNGVVVDVHAQTSDSHIWAAGDCTNFPSRRYGRRMRLESVPNAIEQAKAAGANMAGGDVIYDAAPWFWSDQYDVKLQTVGLGEGADEMVLRGNPAEKAFSVWRFLEGELLCVDAINDPGAFAVGKKALTLQAKINRDKLADVSAPPPSLIL